VTECDRSESENASFIGPINNHKLHYLLRYKNIWSRRCCCTSSRSCKQQTKNRAL